jgi:hypothetical protein
MTADLDLLRKREALLTARIQTTEDPFLRENLYSDLHHVVRRIATLLETAA